METKQYEIYQPPMAQVVEVKAENIICLSGGTSGNRQDYDDPIQQTW